MAIKTIEIRLEIFTDEGWMPVIAVDNITRGVMIDYIEKGIFEDEVNPGLQNNTNTCIAFISSTEDSATFEVVDGWAEPCLKHPVSSEV
jgi:hypothetical protein